MVLKPYHGVYIFLNEGDNRFIQKYFFPVNGCYKAIVRDFEKDGNLDIATIAFFADYKNLSGEGFVHLQMKEISDLHPLQILNVIKAGGSQLMKVI